MSAEKPVAAQLFGLRRLKQKAFSAAFLALGKPEGRLGIWLAGHRNYVGGLWDAIGGLQLNFMLQRGLKPRHILLDIGCGSLRAGVHFIKYLDPGNYLGMDKEKRIIELGVDQELGPRLLQQRSPEFAVSEQFEFEKFSKRPDFALAQSLFTHLNEQDIRLCLTKLRRISGQDIRFYATYFISENPRNSPAKSHSAKEFWYTRSMAEKFGLTSGWRPNYIGDWGHPRGQKMMEYVAE
jgi:hypothetical protein